MSVNRSHAEREYRGNEIFFFQEVVSGSSAECNKEKAKDSSNTVGERIGAGVDYVKDKAEEAGHTMSKEVNKQKAMH